MTTTGLRHHARPDTAQLLTGWDTPAAARTPDRRPSAHSPLAPPSWA